jgi:hypothetical protein
MVACQPGRLFGTLLRVKMLRRAKPELVSADGATNVYSLNRRAVMRHAVLTANKEQVIGKIDKIE